MPRLPDSSRVSSSRSPRREEIELLFGISEKRAVSTEASVERLGQGRARAGGGEALWPSPSLSLSYSHRDSAKPRSFDPVPLKVLMGHPLSV